MTAPKRDPESAPDPAARRLVAARVVLAFVVYCAVLHGDPVLAAVPDVVMFGAVGASLLAFVACVIPVARTMDRRRLADAIGFELAGVGVVGIAWFAEVRFFDAVFYHLFVWLFLPLRWLKDAKAKLTFVAQTVGASAAFFVLTPWVGLHPRLNNELWPPSATCGATST